MDMLCLALMLLMLYMQWIALLWLVGLCCVEGQGGWWYRVLLEKQKRVERKKGGCSADCRRLSFLPSIF